MNTKSAPLALIRFTPHQRATLRAAIQSAPGWGAYREANRVALETMSKVELLTAATALGVTSPTTSRR